MIGILVLLNVVAQFFYINFDLTEDKRYSLTQPTKDLIRNLDDRMFITVYLEGDLPAGFRRLQTGVTDLLKRFRTLSRDVDFQFVDPNDGDTKDVNDLRERLKEVGIAPTNLIVKDGSERKEILIFPAAVISYKGRSIPVNLLEENRAGVNQEVVLNNSVQQLEYKFANAFQKIRTADRKYIFFTEGHGELPPYETADIQMAINKYHYTGRISLDSIVQINPRIDVLIIAKPTRPFSEKDKFKIDQFVMNGGKVIWLVDKLAASLDSLRGKRAHVPIDFKLNLDDQLFKYGVRLDANMVLDLECTPIPLQVGGTAQDPQYEMIDFWYHLALAPTNVEHPIVKGLDRLDIRFAGSLDTVATKNANIKKSIILQSSNQSRMMPLPSSVDFEIFRYEPDRSRFNKTFNLGVLLEGEFQSLYRNRVPQSMMDTLKILGQPFKEKSTSNRMIVISDGDIIKNEVRIRNNQPAPMPLGLNEFARYTFANKDFMLNCIEYMLGDEGLIEARSKEIKLRMLNEGKIEEERTFWQFINIGLPLLVLALFGLVYNFIRRRRFAN